MTAIRRVNARTQDDVIERFFEWSEKAFCPHHETKDKLPLEEDVLDYVFEQVHSFACAEDAMRDTLTTGQPRTLQRDNSLIESGVEGYPASDYRVRRIQPFGQEGDFLDTCFEQVEAYTCKEGAEQAYPRKSALFTFGRGRRAGGRGGTSRKFEEVYAELEADDEIQLYFRPTRSSRD